MTSNSTTDCETERMYNDERKISTQKVRKGWKTSAIKSCQNENRKGFQRESSWYSHDRLARLGWNYATLSRWQLSASRARVTTHWVGNPYSTTKTEKNRWIALGSDATNCDFERSAATTTMCEGEDPQSIRGTRINITSQGAIIYQKMMHHDSRQQLTTGHGDGMVGKIL